MKLMEFKDNEEAYEIVETFEIDYNQEYDSSRGDRKIDNKFTSIILFTRVINRIYFLFITL
jgi:hypothetical protein